jgi:hypothetical protein
MGVKDHLTSQDRLILIRVKIERAKKHLADLERELRKWRRLQKKASRAKPNFDLPEEMRPVLDMNLSFEAVAIAGDVAQNLRSALDHLAYHLVLANGEKPSTNTAFPIHKDATTYGQQKARRVKGMRSDAIEAIDKLKPYRGGDDFLWKLNELSNIDKHRALFTVGGDVQFHADWIGGAFLMKASKPDFAGIFDGQVEQGVKLEVSKALTQPEISPGDALLPTLHQLADTVEGLILSFEPLLRYKE